MRKDVDFDLNNCTCIAQKRLKLDLDEDWQGVLIVRQIGSDLSKSKSGAEIQRMFEAAAAAALQKQLFSVLFVLGQFFSFLY